MPVDKERAQDIADSVSSLISVIHTKSDILRNDDISYYLETVRKLYDAIRQKPDSGNHKRL